MANPLSVLADKLRKAGLLAARLAPAAALAERRRQPRQAAGNKGTLVWDDANGERHMETVRIRDISRYGIGLASTAPVAVGQTVWLEPTSGELIRGVVRHCEKGLRGEYLLGMIRIYAERRRVERQPVEGNGTLDWYDHGGKQASAPAQVLNATEFGLQLRVPREVPVLQIARLSGKSIGCEGTVCYCVPDRNGYVVGLHFTHTPYQTTALDYSEAI